MPFGGSGLPPVAYREARQQVFPFTTETAVGLYSYPIFTLPAGARILQATLLVEVAGVGGGATSTGLIVHQDLTVILGATPIDLKATGLYDFSTAAGSGGPTSVVTARKKSATPTLVSWINTIASAPLTVPASGILILKIADEDSA